MATGKSAGRVSVRVVPDSTKFRDDLKPQLEAIEKRARVTIQAAIETSGIEENLGQLKERLKRTKLPKVNIDADLKRFDAAIKQTEARLAGNPMHLRLEADADRAQKELDKFRKAQGVGPLTLEVQAKIDKAEADIKKIRDEAKKQKIILETEAATKAAAAEIKVVSRPRIVPLVLKVNKASLVATGVALAGAAAALTRISGARAAGDQIRRIGSYLANLDRNVPKLAAVGLAISTISAAALASSAGVLTLASGLTQVAGAAVVLPAILAGGAVSMITLGLALKDTKERLKELKDPLADFQKSISGKFWREAERPLTVMAKTLLPRLESSMGRVSSSLGRFTASLASALQVNLTRSALSTMMGNLAVAIVAASFALRPLINAFVTLGKVGSSYLPAMGKALADLAYRFNQFVSQAAADGSLKEWADNGISALRTLGAIVGSVSSILGGLFKAADRAGQGNGLTAFADNLRAIADVINGPAFQGALTTLFKGALAAMSGLGKAIAPIGDMIVALAPALAQVMATAGDAVGGLLGTLAKALSSPVFADGLTGFFSGIADGLKAIGPALPAVVTALGALGNVAGTIAANLGGVLGAALQALAPVVVILAQALQPLIPMLGTALVSAVQTLAPALQMLVVALGQGLAAIIPALVPIVGQLATTFAAVVKAVIPVIPPILQMVASLLTGLLPAVVALTPVLTQLASNIATVLVVAVQSLVPLIPQLSTAWAYLAQSIVPLVGLFNQFLQAILPFIPALVQAAVTSSVFAAVLTGALVGALVAIAQKILEFSTGVRTMASTVATGAALVISRVTAMAAVVLAGFNRARAAVTAAMNAIRSIIFAVVSAAIARVSNWISSTVARIRSGFSQAASAVSSAMARIRSTIFSTVAAAISRIASFVSNIVSRIRSGFNSAVSAVTSAMSRMVSAISAGVSRAVAAIRDLPSRARAALGNVGSLLYSAGSNLVSGFVNGIRGAIGRVAAAAASAARAAVNAAKSALKIGSPSKEFLWIGQMTGEGMALGIEDKQVRVAHAIEGLSSVRSFRVPSVSDYYDPGAGGGRQTEIRDNVFYNFGPADLVDEIRRKENADNAMYGSW